MPDSLSLRASADRNLLFGILALQMDFIDRDALIAAMNAWVLQKDRPLGQVLLERGALREPDRELLEALVVRHLELHGQDAEKSLASLSSLGSAGQQLEQIADADLHASLAHVATGPAEDPHGTRAPSVGSLTSSGQRFRILRPHRKGGLGEVFVAEDQELHREVALKEIQEHHADDLDSRLRFIREAEVTGGLEHPGIVPVYGLGSYADGRPFYAMRFIKGDSLYDAIARFHNANDSVREPGERALGLRQLLGRFLDVCNAIAYAHSRGVLHRDLKPGNVMLGPYGETLVVDWGLARTFDESNEGSGTVAEAPLRPVSGSGSAPTQMGQALGTPAYMSPEQAAGRLDQLGPASDVYGLGAILYHLLTGRAPFEGSDAGAILQRVREGDLVPPRRVNPRAPAALEAVCLKAMARKAEDRYRAPRALADDLEHWLADEPVSAYREPLRTRLARWGRRHRPLVASAAVLLVAAVVALSTGLVLLGRKQAEVVQERNAARRAKAQEGAINKFLVEDLLAAARPEELGKDVPMRKVLDRAAKKVERAFADQPEVEAAVRLAIGDSYYSLGLYKEAEPHLRRAVELRREHLGPEHPDTLNAINSFGVLHIQQGKYDEAEQLLRKNLEDRRRISGSEHPDTLTAMANLYWLLEESDKLDEAEPLFRECLEARRRVLGPEHRDTLTSLSDWAWFHYRKGKLAEAEVLNRECLAVRRRTLGPEHPDTLMSMGNLAICLKQQSKLGEAEALYRECWQLRRRVLGPEHHYTRGLMGSLAEVLEEQGKFDEAVSLARDSLEITRRTFGLEDRRTLTSQAILASALQQQGKLDEAEGLFRETLATETRLWGLKDTGTLTTMNNLALLLQDQGKWDEAEKLLRQTVKISRAVQGAEDRDTLIWVDNLAWGLMQRGKLDEAEPIWRQNLEIRRRLFGTDDADTLTNMRGLALVLERRGKLEEVEPIYRQILAGRRRVLGPEDRYTLISIMDLASALADQGKLDEAERLSRELLAVQRKKFPPGHKDLAATLVGLGSVLTTKGRPKEAEPLLRAGLEIRQKTLPKHHWTGPLARSVLGGCLTALGRYNEAEPLLLNGYEQMKACPVAPARRVKEALDRIIKLYEDWQKPDKAALWRAERAKRVGPPNK
ncbi:MAG: serine/threonine protein kinase [Planctomycetes bacterium]|nr:serine/threonine protein kinase [Planctomycetota bacterium]